MAATDVVKQKLSKSKRGSVIDWTEDVEPMPMPVVRRKQEEETGRVEGEEPDTRRVSGERLTMAPYRSVGKMRLIIGGRKLAATGWVVAPRAFITAGHCVYDERYGGWITSATLCPRFDNECVKAYTVTTVYALKGWVDSGADEDYRYDMAACVVSEKFADTEPPLPFVVGGGRKPGTVFAAIGYPKHPIPGHAFNGKRMWKSVGHLIEANDAFLLAENNLTSGASGGPWCEPFNNYVVSGINSSYYEDADMMRSPLFSNGFQNLYNAVKNIR